MQMFYQVCSNDDPRMTVDLFLWQDQICIPILLYEENVEKSFSQNVLKAEIYNVWLK